MGDAADMLNAAMTNKSSPGMFSKFMNFGFNGNNQQSNNATADMTITGEGCQPLSDMGWKKKENKYLGTSSHSEKEQKEAKELLK